jgi:hypothetical protein
MNDQELNNLVAQAINLDEWVITKNGYYYRPNACGYTDRLSEAWKVPLETAKKYEMYADNPKVAFYDKVLIKKAPMPDFGGDLNEMRRAENCLSDEQWTDYINMLYFVTFKPAAKDRDRQAINSSAAEKREAFLKALKLI